MVFFEDWVNRKHQRGLLDYKWAIRRHLLKHTQCDPHEEMLFLESLAPFLYLQQYALEIQQDRSLQAVCHLCTDLDLVANIEHQDAQLAVLGERFNQLMHSGRELRACYDCGTTARGVFFQLIKAYRGTFHLTSKEINQVRDEYYMTRYRGAEGVPVLRSRVENTSRNCLFMCAMQLGDTFGHVYILEKIRLSKESLAKRPHYRYRLYQSCLRAYLLIDYIEKMDYARHLDQGIDVTDHLDALQHLFSHETWGTKENNLFIQWFKFIPPADVKTNHKKSFTSTCIVF